jgi:hypothetical protein
MLLEIRLMIVTMMLSVFRRLNDLILMHLLFISSILNFLIPLSFCLLLELLVAPLLSIKV